MKNRLFILFSVGLILLVTALGCSSQNESGEGKAKPSDKSPKVVGKAPKAVSSVNYGHFKKIKIGDKIEKAQEILQDKPTRVKGEGDKKEYIWESRRVVNINKKNVKCKSSICLNVEKGVIVAKRQANLGTFGKVVPDEAKLKSLKEALAKHKLSYQEACKIMGGSGLLFKQSRHGKSKRSEYIWQGAPLKGRTIKSGKNAISVVVYRNKVTRIYTSTDLDKNAGKDNKVADKNKADDKNKVADKNKANDKSKVADKNKADDKNKVADKPNKAADKQNKVTEKDNKVAEKDNKASETAKKVKQ